MKKNCLTCDYRPLEYIPFTLRCNSELICFKGERWKKEKNIVSIWKKMFNWIYKIVLDF